MARSKLWLWQWMDVAEWKQNLLTVMRSRSKEVRLLDALSLTMMDLLMMMTEMWMKRETVSEAPTFQWLSFNNLEVRIWQWQEGKKTSILWFLNQITLLLIIFTHAFIHLLKLFSGNPLRVVFFSMLASSVDHLFYIAAIHLSSSVLVRVPQNLFVSPLIFTIYTHLCCNLLLRCV